MAPQFEALSKTLTNVNFIKVDVDAAPVPSYNLPGLLLIICKGDQC